MIQKIQTTQTFDVVMICMSSMSEWQQGVVNRNRLILRNIRKRPEIRKVLVVDFLPFTLKRAARNWVENIFFGIKGMVIKRSLFDRCVCMEENLYVYSTVESFWSEQMVLKKLKYLIKKLEFKNILLWSYQPMFVEYFDALGEEKSVFDAVDNWYENIHYKKYRKRLEKNYRTIGQRADTIFTVANDLVTFFHTLERDHDVHWVPNGVESADFKNPTAPPNIINFFTHIPRPIIGYIGTIQNRVDFSLIDFIAKRNPQWSVVLAGPTWPVYFKHLRSKSAVLKMLQKNKNVYFIGQIPYSYMPYVVSQFDVGIIPHTVDVFVQSMNPMKMYDYLAAGKPIVSTPSAGVSLFKDLISVAPTPEEFVFAIQRALDTDSIELQALRRRRVEEHSYTRRVDDMLSYLLYEKLA